MYTAADLEVIVQELVKGGSNSADVYRKIIHREYDRFCVVMELLESELDDAEVFLFANKESPELGRRLASEHLQNAHEAIMEAMELATKLAIGGKQTAREAVARFSERLDKCRSTSRGASSGSSGCFTIITAALTVTGVVILLLR